MRLSRGFFTSLTGQQGDIFDNEVADILASRYARVAAWSANERYDWVRLRRRWLEGIGVIAQQHILDHLEVMAVNGSHIIDDPDYRAIIMRPFQSQEEKAVMLRRRFLPSGDE